MDQNIVLEFKDIRKEYPGVVALDGVNLALKRGEVHALAGENGAGKSTLIKTCTGAIKPTRGNIIVNGKKFDSFTPTTSRENGIGVIYQEFNLVNQLPVYENVFMGEFIQKGGVINKSAMIKKSKELFEMLNINIDPTSLVGDLTVGYQQMVEIAKAVSKETNILIMDEPSAPLTNQEVDAMFKMIERLKQRGITILYISHRLDEIFQICDRVTILRDGKFINTLNIKETNREELVRYMVGRPLTETYPERIVDDDADIMLEAEKLSGNGVNDISFKVRKGEILGFGGLIGAGRTELAHLIFGVEKIGSGKLIKEGKQIAPQSPEHAINMGIALVPEDRKQQGVELHMSIRENITMAILKRISMMGYVSGVKEKQLTTKLEKELRIKTPSLEQLVGNLSGGNQQKVVLAKWLASEPDIIIFDEPTRGIDVGAKQEIYMLMNELTKQGKAVIMISSDMEELLGMSDRIIVLSEGRLAGELKRDEFSQEAVMTLASKES